jgi:prepilin-type processing-associated H-X9-DG protein
VTAPELKAPEPPVTQPPKRISLLALISFLLGVASTGFLALAGVPAFFCGYRALYQINVSEGRLRGRVLAITGMIWGALATVVTVFFFVMLVSLHLNSRSNQAACANNLRQIGQALLQYKNNNQDTFPAASRRGASLAVEDRLSWMTSILPFLETRPNRPSPWSESASRFDPNQVWNAGNNHDLTQPFVACFICPSWDTMPTQVPAGLTSYIGMAGVGLDAPTLPPGDPNAGFFGYDRLTTMADLRWKGGGQAEDSDSATGSSYILITTETLRDNGPWAEGGPSTCRGISADSSTPLGRDCPFGGLHQGGANALHADGSVHFESDGINPQLFRTLVRLKPDDQ